MRTTSRCLRLARAGLGVSFAGGGLLACIPLLPPGGHPPLAAYLFLPTLLLALAAGGSGLIASALELRAARGPRRPVTALIAVQLLVLLGVLGATAVALTTA